MEEAFNDIENIEGDGHKIIELLYQADSLLRDELRMQCSQETSPGIKFLLEAQLNVSRAIEALYDRASSYYTF